MVVLNPNLIALNYGAIPRDNCRLSDRRFVPSFDVCHLSAQPPATAHYLHTAYVAQFCAPIHCRDQPWSLAAVAKSYVMVM